MRLELLTDPNLPAGGPWTLRHRSTGALTEFTVEAAPAEAPDKIQKLKIARATADINLPERPLDGKFVDPKLDNRPAGKKRVTGPVNIAIDGNNDTAWGIDAGPGLRNQSRKAVFNFEKPVGFPKGTVLNIYLAMNHGGANSDDNENNNLGRIRLSLTDRSRCRKADPVPQAKRPRYSRHPALTSAPRRRSQRRLQLLAHHGS